MIRPDRSPMPPVFVHKDGEVWRWVCRGHSCGRSEWRVRHGEALADAHRHLSGHRSFGFGGKR